MGGMVWSGKNAILEAAWREERSRVQTPEREEGKRRRRIGKASGKRSIKNAIVADCQWPLESTHRLCDATARPKRAHVLFLHYHFLADVDNRHLVVRLGSLGMVLSAVRAVRLPASHETRERSIEKSERMGV